MPTVIRMPEVLTGMTEAVLVTWHVAPGDKVLAGQAIAEVETEKATVDIEADREGVAAQHLVAAGDAVTVGTPILALAFDERPPEEVRAEEPTAVATAPYEGAGTTAPGPVPRRFTTPLVRKLARERGIDLATVTGTGPGGRVVRRDLDRLQPQPRTNAPAAEAGQDAAAPPGRQRPADPPMTDTAPVGGRDRATDAAEGGFQDVPHSAMRRAIARRLTESKTSVPHFYMEAECRVDALLDLRRTIKENDPAAQAPSVNDFVVKAAAAAFRDVPEANVIWTADALRRFDSVSIAVAVSLDDGLVTPVVRDVDRRSLSDISRTTADLAARARQGRLRQDELEGGSFTVSNLGMYGITRFSSIISPPHSGILAVGAAQKRPVVDDTGAVRAATLMTVTLSGDHRAIDGALAARWLRAFQQIVENPLRILL
jgi:pyruvate dehydrogenase E2 component (dihydrolipoamide acetyltransferase)